MRYERDMEEDLEEVMWIVGRTVAGVENICGVCSD